MSKKTQEIRSIFQELGSLQKRIENLKHPNSKKKTAAK